MQSDTHNETGNRYLGGYIGSKEGKEEWIKPKVKEWATSVEILSRITRIFLQAAYTGFVLCLQCEWGYIIRVVPGVAPFLTLIDDTIRRHFIPSLFDVPPDFITGNFCIRFSHSVKRAGIREKNPVDSTPYNVNMLKAVCALIA